MYECSLERMTDKIKTMSQFGDAGHGGITRYSLSPEALQARGEFVRRMEAIGATIKFDDMANLYATLPGSEPDLPGIVMASHCDSVKNGGNYDGILGVMGAMEVLETVADQNIPHKHNLTAMIWTNEEGSLYPPAMMSSGVICYDYLPEDIRVNFKHEDMLKSTSVLDATKTFGAALDASGYKGDKANRLNNKDYKAMFELHIEQGPILEAAGNDIGVVTCVLGMVVRREREIREFIETPFYRILATIGEQGQTFEGEWRAVKGSKWFESFDLYKENGFKEREKAQQVIDYLTQEQPVTGQIASIEKKKEKKNY